VPRYGVQGAAVATALAYAVLAGVSAVFARRVYPVDYEWRRMAQLAAAGLCGYAVAVLVVPGTWANVPALLARVLTASAVYIGLLVVTGFATAAERRRVMEVWGRARSRHAGQARPAEVDTEVSETTELAGNVISATGGEVIAAPPEDDPDVTGVRRP